MEINYISILTLILSIPSMILSFLIFQKIYNQKHKRPWLYISISSIFIMLKSILEIVNIKIINSAITIVVLGLLNFVSVSLIFFALLLEYLITKYYKGKFLKIKFIPVQEGTLSESFDINISNGEAYLAYKKDKQFLLEEFSKGVKSGFEGFLLVENSPKEIREKYNLQKTPIAWITQISDESSYIKENLTENSDVVEPIKINQIVDDIDLFLEEAERPFILIEINEIIRINNIGIVFELLNYISNKVKNRNGILIVMLNRDIEKDLLFDLRSFLKDLT